MARILLTDDSEYMRTLLKKILAIEGHEVVAEASDGKECLAQYKEIRPDLVLLDIIMPRMSGLETVRELRRIDPAVRVVMVSADHQRSHVDRAVAEGASGFVVKPFKKDDLLREVARVLSGNGPDRDKA
jgi:two-component system chemotaxis response regulator CheY